MRKGNAHLHCEQWSVRYSGEQNVWQSKTLTSSALAASQCLASDSGVARAAASALQKLHALHLHWALRAARGWTRMACNRSSRPVVAVRRVPSGATMRQGLELWTIGAGACNCQPSVPVGRLVLEGAPRLALLVVAVALNV